MALRSEMMSRSMLRRTRAGSSVPRVSLNPTFTLFSHIQFFLVKPSTQEVQYVVVPEQVRHGLVQARQLLCVAAAGNV